MEVDLNRKVEHLLNNILIEKISYKKIKINSKGRIYNPSKPPSKILTKVVNSLYNEQCPKESKPTRRIRKVKEAAANSANVLLKLNKPRRVERNRFSDFDKDFYDSQNNKENAQIAKLKFRVVTSILEMDPDTGEKIGDTKIHTTEVFIEAETVYGGDVGLKLYIKYKIMQLVRRLEDSIMYIKKLTLTNMYVSRRDQDISIGFRQIRMYVTLYDYKGYGSDTNNYDGACVPNHLSETYNNREETNPRNRISKLNIAKLLEILGMQNMYEGCSIEQIAIFCNI